MSHKSKLLYEFGPFRLDTAERLLLRVVEVVPLTPKAFDLLLVLVERHGHLVEKEELMKTVWPDSFVEEANLSYTVSAIRKALGNGAEGQRYIETVPKRGYRFVAPVRERTGESELVGSEVPALQPKTREENGARTTQDVAPTATLGAERLARTFGRHKVGAAAVTVALVAFLAVGLQRLLSPGKAIDSLAVLPFVNAGGDSISEYLSDGLTETLINNLSQLGGLRVMARTTVFRYKGNVMDPVKVGHDLNVRAVLTGKILQKGDRLVIQADLVDVTSGAQLWGEQYNRKLADIFALQEDIALRISENLKVKLSGDEKHQLTKRHTADFEAYQLYLKGRYYWNKVTEEGLRKGIEYFQQAIEKDPSYGLAYAGLAECYYLLILYSPPQEMFPRARAYATRALEIDDALAEAHTTLACIKDFYEGDPAGAEREYQRAIKLNPGYPTAHQRYSLLLLERLRTEESLAEIKRALELDPVSLSINTSAGSRLYFARRYDRALEQLRKAIELDANFPQAHVNLGRVYEQMGMYQDAVAEFRRALSLSRSSEALAALGHVYAVSGSTPAALTILAELQELSKRRYVSPIEKAQVYAGLEKKDEALAWLQKACDERTYGLTVLHLSPVFDTLRSDSRFSELIRRIGLPD